MVAGIDDNRRRRRYSTRQVLTPRLGDGGDGGRDLSLDFRSSRQRPRRQGDGGSVDAFGDSGSDSEPLRHFRLDFRGLGARRRRW